MAESSPAAADKVCQYYDKDGVPMPLAMWGDEIVAPLPGVTSRLDRFCSGWKARATDVWVLAYAKSGTHWVNEITSMLIREELSPSEIKEECMVEAVDLESLEALSSPRLLNCHLPYFKQPESVRNSKIIYIDRNPKSVAVSLYNHSKQDQGFQYHGTWEAFLDLFVAGKVLNGSWFDYIQQWQDVARKKPDNVLFLRYEWLKENNVEGVRRIAEFLGFQRSEQFIQTVAKQTNFSVQQKLNENKTFGGINMYRKGSVSDWKNWFTVAQNEQFDEFYNNRMSGFCGDPFQFDGN